MTRQLQWSIRVNLLLLACCLLGSVLQNTAWAKPERLVRIGAFNFYPAIFQDTDGKIKGFYVDALNHLADQENLRIEYVYGSWAEGLQRAQSGEIDVLTSVAYTEERARFLDYSKTPLLTVWGELYVPLASEIDSITKMQGKTVAVMEDDFNGRSFIELADKFGIACQFIELPGFEEVFQAVADKRVDAGVVNNTFGASKQRSYSLRSTGIVFNPFNIHFAVAKGQNPDLLALLESYLHRWRYEKNSIYLQARLHWEHGALEKVPVTPKWLIVLLAALGAATLLASAFIMLLRRQVAQATEAIAQREASLRETAEMKQLLLDSAAEGLFGLDRDGRCTFCNAACLNMLGFARSSQLIGRNMHELIHHTDSAGQPLSAEDCMTMQALRAEQACHGENEIYWRVDGSSFPVELWARPIHRADQVIGSVITFIDITERKQLEASYQFISQSGYSKSADNFFNALVQHLGDSLMLDFVFIARLADRQRVGQALAVYHNGVIEENRAYDLQGTPCDETLGKAICFFTKGVRNRFPQAALLQKLEAESYIGATLWGFDGQPIGFIAGISSRPLANTKLAESIFKLVSLRAAGELERHQAGIALQQKNQEIERFTYAVSHDLKSPLVTIKTFLGYLQQDLADGSAEAVEKDLDFMRTAAEKMSRLLDELLRMSRVGRRVNPQQPRTFVELVNEALTAVAGAIEKRGVEIQVEEAPTILRGDPSRLAEIWQNLIDNAVKYMGPQLSPRIEIGLRRDKQNQVFYVRDNGIGIDPRHSGKIFGLFEKLDPATEGTGLGLALVKKIVEHYQGSIWVESAGPGHGSCFLFTLPEVFNQQGDTDE